MKIIQETLDRAAATWDWKKQHQRHYNPYAYGQYLTRNEEIIADIDSGADPRAAIVRGFHGPLCNHMLRAIGEKRTTPDERNSQTWNY
jgi:hypothetical protein